MSNQENGITTAQLYKGLSLSKNKQKDTVSQVSDQQSRINKMKLKLNKALLQR